MIENKNQRPLLHCKKCGVATIHRYSRTTRGKAMEYAFLDNPVPLLEHSQMKRHMWICLKCDTERQWGSE